MTTKIEATVKNLKDAQGEISAWEGRLITIKAQVGNLQKQKDTISNEIESMRTIYGAELEKKQLQSRQEAALLDEQKKNLEKDKADFFVILQEFKKEKNAFEREKSDILAAKDDFVKRQERVNSFVTYFKREAEKL